MPLGSIRLSDEAMARPYDLPTALFDNMRKFSTKRFLVDGLTGDSRTFEEMLNDALKVAKELRNLGVDEGSFVAIMADLKMEAFIFVIAVWLSGGCACPLNAGLSIDEIAQILDITTATIVFCESDKLPVLEAAAKNLHKKFTVITDTKHDEYISIDNIRSANAPTFTPDAYEPESHVVSLLFTSGTTGVPKGVMLSSYASMINGYHGFRDISSTFLTSPLYWITNPATFLYSLIYGTELIFTRPKLLPGTNKQDFYHLLHCIEKYKPAKWITGPSVLSDLANLPDAGKYDLSSLTHISAGGAPVLASLKKILSDTLFNGRNIVQDRFGCTEAGAFSPQLTNPLPDFDDKKAASFGPLALGVEAKIVDVDSGKELGPNEVGELFVRTNSIMIGYINRDLPQRYTKYDWYRVGDCCMYDEDGWFYYKTRVKEIIKYRGYQMAPVDIEKVAIQHPDVAEVCVIAKPHPVDGEHPVAFVVKKPGSNLNEEVLTAFVNGKVSDEKRLRGGAIFIDALPRSSVGKLLRNKLAEQFKT